jgi:TubC N-terminal docking domain
MQAAQLLNALRTRGFSLTPLPGGRLEVSPASKLTDELRSELKQRKPEILALLSQPLPYINSRSELIIPFNADPRYRYWAGGQSIAATLRELRAPPEVWARYTEAPYGPVH